MGKNEVAVTEDKKFNLVTMAESGLSEAIAEEMDGLGSIPYDKVKIPSGGGLAFEIPGETEDDPQTATELVGVILFHHPLNGYWEEEFNGSNDKPNCSSLDGKTGVISETGEIRDCANCEFNKFGTAKNGSGKACKNMHRIYFLQEDNPVPLIVTLPPTSIKSLRDYISKRILLRGMRCYSAVTKITLKKDKNAAGIAYSKAVFTFVKKLDADQVSAAEGMAKEMKKIQAFVDIDDSDYDEPEEPKTDNDGFMAVPDNAIDEDLPFN
nr:MAG TPA: hypothetical protein [Caudoviricetes sp.]